jgi:hypothetical protein
MLFWTELLDSVTQYHDDQSNIMSNNLYKKGKMLNGAPETLVKKILYNKNVLELPQS